LRVARSEAITFNKEVRFRLDLETGSFTIGEQETAVSLPPEVDVVMFTATSEILDGRAGAIRFFTDGSSTGGGITLTAEDRKYEILVDWLTGRVSIVD
jgi:general secretion pathway protein H